MSHLFSSIGPITMPWHAWPRSFEACRPVGPPLRLPAIVLPLLAPESALATDKNGR